MIKLSRSKLELLFECPRCFWLYAGKGMGRPFGPPFTINSAIDFMLKKEFDEHRNKGTAHHLIKEAGIDAIPYLHEDIDKWRNNFTGIQYHHKPKDFLVFGAVDDSWVEDKILEAKKILGGKIPKPNNDCDFCKYREAVRQFEK